jgi:DNA-binding transcriptional MerR regulator
MSTVEGRRLAPIGRLARALARHRVAVTVCYTYAYCPMTSAETVQIPNRSLFRQPEVCEIAQVQPYVLRSWEAEFPDLGVAKTKDAPRVYRRADVERVLRIKHLVVVEGLTLAGVRRKMLDERPSAAPEAAALDDLLSSDARERILSVRKTLRELSAMLGARPRVHDAEFVLEAPAVKPRAARASAAAAKTTKRASAKKR